MSRKVPWTIQWHLRLHRKHRLTHYNDTISVPSWDPSARGILADCSCGKGWAL